MLEALLLAVPLAAPIQDDAAAAPEAMSFEPAAELLIYEPLVGQWEATGTATMMPGMPAMKWTGTLDLAWIADGHALLEVLRIDVGGGMPTMEMVTLRAYDRANKRILEWGTGTSGGFNTADMVHSPKPGTIVAAYSGMEMGAAYADHARWSADGDEMDFVIHRTTDGAPYEYVRGSFERKAMDGEAVEANATRADAVADDLAPLAPMVGKWNLTGTYRATPDMPEMKINGNDEIAPICGGQALLFESTGGADGSPMVYRSVAMVAWDAELEAFQQVWADNMGTSGLTTLRPMGEGRLVSTQTGLEGEQPYADISEVHMKDGALQTAFTDRMMGGKSFRAFFGRYERAE